MNRSWRKSVPNGRRPPRRVPFRPFLEALEDRLAPAGSLTVTNFADNGGGDTLRDPVAQANANTSGAFTINLAGGVYNLFQNAPLSFNNTTNGTLIVVAGSTDPNNPTILNESGLSRVLQVSSGTSVVLDNVTVEHGRAQDDPSASASVAGGGLLNDGGTVVLTNDVFLSNTATATHGGAAEGGGIFSVGGSLLLDTVSLLNNVAAGGNGSPGDGGGEAKGGGLAEIDTNLIVTDVPITSGTLIRPLPVPFDASTLTRPLLTVAFNTARGGDGAAGVASVATTVSATIPATISVAVAVSISVAVGGPAGGAAALSLAGDHRFVRRGGGEGHRLRRSDGATADHRLRRALHRDLRHQHRPLHRATR